MKKVYKRPQALIAELQVAPLCETSPVPTDINVYSEDAASGSEQLTRHGGGWNAESWQESDAQN